jgi:orotate phosphoribosyltransferase
MITGGSIRLTIEVLRQEGFNVQGVFTVLDREENNELRKTFKCFSFLKQSQFKPFIEEHVKRKKKTKIEN